MRSLLLTVLIAAVLAGPLAVSARAQQPKAPVTYRDVADKDVDRVIKEIQRYLIHAQREDGSWEIGTWHYQIPRGYLTAWVLFALIESGMPPTDPAIKKGLDYLVKFKTDHIYVVATRAIVLAQVQILQPKNNYTEAFKKDLAWLTKNGAVGAWGLKGPQKTGDNQSSQFALLALKEAYLAGEDIRTNLWRAAERTWLRRQKKDGGWSYAGQPGAKDITVADMTAAALASIYLTQDLLMLRSGPYPRRKDLDRGWAFLAKNVDKDFIHDGYLAFCIQRCGMASGRKFIGDMDWFATGAAVLCAPTPGGRRYKGRVSGVLRAAYELLFLSRGRIPLTFNKLQHGDESEWNYHTRDLPRFADFTRRNFERRMRWQVVNLNEDLRRLLDAPVLLICGTKAPEFTDADWAKLREYALRGGLLLFVPTKNSSLFTNAVKAKLAELFAPERKAAGKYYTLEQLPDDHPLYTVHHKFKNPSRDMPMWGLSDGTRLLAVVAEKDFPASWQARKERLKPDDYGIGVNLFFYGTGRNDLGSRLRPVFPGADKKPRGVVRIGQLVHDGNWNSQPYALETLSQKLTAENFVEVEETDLKDLSPNELKNVDLIWMTGSDAFKLPEAKIKALRQYLDDGGLLFINAVGGAKPFNTSAEDLIEDLFEGRNVRETTPQGDDPLVTGKLGEHRGPAILKTQRTRDFKKRYPTGDRALQAYAEDGAVRVIYAPFGIHDTLDGHTVSGAYSYMPDTARDLAANVALSSLVKRTPIQAKKPAPATTSAPTSRPTEKK